MDDFELEDVKPYLNKFQLDSAAKATANLNLNEGSIKREDVNINVNKGSSIFDFPSSSSPPLEVQPPSSPPSSPPQPQRSQPIKRGMTQREVIFDAISELKEKSGCTFKDILRYIELVHQTEIDKKKAAQIKQMLKKCVDNGSLTLVHEKRAGLLINSYRIPHAPEKSIKQLIQMAKAQLTTREKGPGISCGLIGWSIGDDNANANKDPFSNLSKSPSPPRLVPSPLPLPSTSSPPHRILMGNDPEKNPTPQTSLSSTVKNKPLTLVIKKESVVAPATVKKEPSTDIKYKLDQPTAKPKSTSSSPLDTINDAIESAISAPSITIKIKAPQAPPPIIVVPLNPKPIKKKKKKSLTKKRKSSPSKRKSKTKKKKASPKKVKIKVKREVVVSAVKKEPPTAVKKEKESVVVKKEKEAPVKVTIKKEKEKEVPVKVTIKKEKEAPLPAPATIKKEKDIPSKVSIKKEKDTLTTPSAKSRAKAIVVSKTKPKPSPPPKASPKAVSVNKKSTPKIAPKKRKTKAKPKSKAKAKGKSKKTKAKKGGKRQPPRVHIK